MKWATKQRYTLLDVIIFSTVPQMIIGQGLWAALIYLPVFLCSAWLERRYWPVQRRSDPA